MKYTKEQQDSDIRVSRLELAIINLDEYKNVTPEESIIALARLMSGFGKSYAARRAAIAADDGGD